MLDVKGAFNNLSWKSVFPALRNIGCPRNIFHLVRSYFKERKVVYSAPSSIQEHGYSMGWSQGSNSGSLYWILVANSLLELDLGPHARTSEYTDDFVVLETWPNAYVISRNATQTLRKIERCAESHKLQFSVAKTSTVFYRKAHDGGRRRAPCAPPRIRFRGQPVKVVKTQAYLGITIDENLNGMAQVANIRAKMAKYTLAVNTLSRRDWGLSGEILNLLFKRGLERIAT